MKKIACFVWLAVISIGSIAQVSIVTNTREKLEFEWNLHDVDTTSYIKGDKRLISLGFVGQNVDVAQFNEPSIPGYSFLLGVPLNGQIQIEIEPVETSQLYLNNPLRHNNDSSARSTLRFSSKWISEPGYSMIGNYRTAQIVIRPVEYNHLNASIVFLRKAKVTITYPSVSMVSIARSESHFSSMMSKLLLNADVAGAWIKTSRLGKKSVEQYPLPVTQRAAFFKIGDGFSKLNEGTINENGVVKISGKKLHDIFGTSIPISKVLLYASTKGMLSADIPNEGAIPAGITEVPMIRVDVNGNGYVDSVDYCLAYVSGTSDWGFDFGYRFKINHYDLYRTYWLTVGNSDGRSYSTFKQPQNPRVNYSSFTNRLYAKRSELRETRSEGGNNWVWQKLKSNDRIFKYTFDFPQLDTTKAGLMYLGTNSDGLNVTFADSLLIRDSTYSYPFKKWGNRTLAIDYTYSGESYYELADITFEYSSRLQLTSEVKSMTAFSSRDSSIVAYSLSGVKGRNVYIFRINAAEDTVTIIDTLKMSLTDTVTWADTGNIGTRYFVCTDSGFIAEPDIQMTSTLTSPSMVTDLRSVNNNSDYLIITHQDFIGECEKLSTHKRKMGFKNPVIVLIDDVYRCFNGGSKDPVAIRNFIAYVKNNWTNGDNLLFTVLVGSGHYDPKRYKTSETDFIPIYQSNSLLQEDFFTYTKPDSSNISFQYGARPQSVIGRFPCKTTAEAAIMVKKIIELEDPTVADYSGWRNRALLVADDDMQGDSYDGIMNSNPHHKSSEKVADTMWSKWPSIDVRKTYLFEYEWNAAREKPGATQAILNEINNGVAYVNFFGHGAEVLWADEHVLRKENISSMANRKQYPLVSSFSCSVGKFDIPGEECLSAALVKADGAGAIAAISSTRLAYASENEMLALDFYKNLFDASKTCIGDAFFRAKVISVSSGNKVYSLLGDPSIQFVRAEKSIELGVYKKDNSAIDSIAALEQIVIKGTVKNKALATDAAYGSEQIPAYVKISLFNAPDTTSRKDGGVRDERYLMPGTPVFIGKAAVVKGAFEQTVYMPKNLSFDKPGVLLTAYAWKDGVEDIATGVNNKLIFHGTRIDSTAGTDTVGPKISIRPVYDNANMSSVNMSLTDKITTMLPFSLQIDLFDESGIDVSGSGPDEGLIVDIPGIINRKTINNKFQFKEGDFREGAASIEIEENEINPGTYELHVYARDLIGNIALRKFALEVTEKEEIKLGQVLNYPNPFRMGQTTRFYFYPSNTTSEILPGTIYVKIYTLGGKLVRTFNDAKNGVVWDGRDQAGNLLSPNIYLYQVSAYNTAFQKMTKSKIKKLVIYPPR